ncbi:TPA: hypothetical protein KE767_004467 [Citrobacter koseri]|nr:hypothetical protein [Citrobacter koseri]
MLYKYIGHLLRMVSGFYQISFSEEWDFRLNEIMVNGAIVEAGEHTVTYQFDGDVIEIWVSNKWYAFGHIYRVNDKLVSKEFQNRPALKTMYRLWDTYSEARNKRLAEEYQSLFKSK